MRVIDCYYIKGYGKESTCTKIRGVGIAYNILSGTLYYKGVTIASGVVGIPPLALMLGLGVGQGFVGAIINTTKNSIGI